MGNFKFTGILRLASALEMRLELVSSNEAMLVTIANGKMVTRPSNLLSHGHKVIGTKSLPQMVT